MSMELRHYDKLLQYFHSSDLCSPANLIAFTITANLNEAAGLANEAAHITIQQGIDIPNILSKQNWALFLCLCSWQEVFYIYSRYFS